ncbi:MAG: phosphatidylserine decarboxylase family protein [Flavobacteriales bacterium]|nr:phosphatidylserine decarboxylase family protein [Flavobacteriales bacterium]
MGLHREGKKILIGLVLILVAINLCVVKFIQPNSIVLYIILGLSFALFILFAQFFRVPRRNTLAEDHQVICPADGKVVTIETVKDPEYFTDERIQVSIFMSPLNVHIQWYPIDGDVTYTKYHEGKYLVAWHPKSSTENERSTTVVKHSSGKEVLFRQIAGAVARRIIQYAKTGDKAEKGSEFGFIKFGSRVDLLFPMGTKILVDIDQKVTGAETVIAEL